MPGKNSRFFLLETLKNCILNEKRNSRWPQWGHFSIKLGHFFPIFEKGRVDPPPLPSSSYAHVQKGNIYTQSSVLYLLKVKKIYFISEIIWLVLGVSIFWKNHAGDI